MGLFDDDMGGIFEQVELYFLEVDLGFFVIEARLFEAVERLFVFLQGDKTLVEELCSRGEFVAVALQAGAAIIELQHAFAQTQFAELLVFGQALGRGVQRGPEQEAD